MRRFSFLLLSLLLAVTCLFACTPPSEGGNSTTTTTTTTTGGGQPSQPSDPTKPTVYEYVDLATDDVLLYTVSEDNTCVIVGHRSETIVPHKLILPATIDGKAVTGIGDKAFAENQILDEIVLPAGLLRIGAWAFKGCTLLTDFTVPNTVTELGEGVFENCEQMVSAKLRGSYSTLPADTFRACKLLERVTLPPSVQSVGANAFYRCRVLDEIGIDGAGSVRLQTNGIGTILTKEEAVSHFIEKKAYCIYDNKNNIGERNSEMLCIYLPTWKGYINWNIVHSKNASLQIDTWRMGVVYQYDDAIETQKNTLTLAGAEWEMAIMLKGRPDFIGGNAHGDELYTEMLLWVDGKPTEVSSLTELTSFDKIVIKVASVGYDPSSPTTAVFKHWKTFTITKCGIRVEQKVEWLGDYLLDTSYLGMMPPLKTVTNTYSLDGKESIPETDIPNAVISGKGLWNSLCVSGRYGLTFRMTVEKYLTDAEGKNGYMLTGDDSRLYNKMYFPIQHNGSVKAGDVWETVTVYQIQAN